MSINSIRHILGYLIGGLLFLAFIPWGLWKISGIFDNMIGIHLIGAFSLRVTATVILLITGAVFALWSIVVQNRIGKGGPLEGAGFEVSPKTKNLVVSGPYTYTRNPMLFGTCMLYYAIAMYLNSLTAFLLVTLFMMLMLIFVKITEERRLLNEFGNEYDDYRRKVAMFIPWRKRHQKFSFRKQDHKGRISRKKPS